MRAEWSERELEDALWADVSLVWPTSDFYWIGRQVTMHESRVDLLGILETGGGRRLAVAELKAHTASGDDLTQLLSYMGILSDEICAAPFRARAALSDFPVFGMLIAPGFTRRVRRAVDLFVSHVMLVEATSPADLRALNTECVYDEARPPHDAIISGLTAPVWTFAELCEARQTRVR